VKTLIKNGTVVTASDTNRTDVLIEGEKVVAIGSGLETKADQVLDAENRYVMPGAIDVHTHMELPFGGTFASDDFATGTAAAAWGGTTTIVDLATQTYGQTLRQGLDQWHKKAEGKAHIDYGFHMIVREVNDSVLKEMDALVKEGVPSFKLFMAYPGVFMVDDAAIFRAMSRTAENGGLIMMHAENGMAIDVVAAEAVEAARARGLQVSGPLSPDTVFVRGAGGEFDAVVAAYHDQGHIPIKMLGLDTGVNVTIGLPIVRTSVDHGTAFDIAGTGQARPANMLAAIRLAEELA